VASGGGDKVQNPTQRVIEKKDVQKKTWGGFGELVELSKLRQKKGLRKE
jgi:hypothetical protein